MNEVGVTFNLLLFFGHFRIIRSEVHIAAHTRHRVRPGVPRDATQARSGVSFMRSCIPILHYSAPQSLFRTIFLDLFLGKYIERQPAGPDRNIHLNLHLQSLYNSRDMNIPLYFNDSATNSSNRLIRDSEPILVPIHWATKTPKQRMSFRWSSDPLAPPPPSSAFHSATPNGQTSYLSRMQSSRVGQWKTYTQTDRQAQWAIQTGCSQGCCIWS